MRTTEERLTLMHNRAAEISRESRHRKVLVLQAAAVILCFAAVIAAAFVMPGFNSGSVAEAGQSGMYASIFAGSAVFGYIAVGIIAFLLGTAVTVFCFRLRKWENNKGAEESHDRDGR